MPSTTFKWFSYKHLPPHLQEVSKLFFDLAKHLEESMIDSPEKSAGMRKLLEAKDCFVRVAKEQHDSEQIRTVENSE